MRGIGHANIRLCQTRTGYGGQDNSGRRHRFCGNMQVYRQSLWWVRCIIGATRGLNEPHYPKLPDILKAKKKEVKQVDIAELGLDLTSPQTEIINLEAVPERGQAQMMEGSTRESVEQLVRILKEEEKVIWLRIWDFGFWIVEGNVIDFISFDYQLWAFSWHWKCFNLTPDTRNLNTENYLCRIRSWN